MWQGARFGQGTGGKGKGGKKRPDSKRDWGRASRQNDWAVTNALQRRFIRHRWHQKSIPRKDKQCYPCFYAEAWSRSENVVVVKMDPGVLIRDTNRVHQKPHSLCTYSSLVLWTCTHLTKPRCRYQNYSGIFVTCDCWSVVDKRITVMGADARR